MNLFLLGLTIGFIVSTFLWMAVAQYAQREQDECWRHQVESTRLLTAYKCWSWFKDRDKE